VENGKVDIFLYLVFLCVGINIECQLLVAFLLLARFCQKEKLQNSKFKKKRFCQFSVDKSEEKKRKNCHMHVFHFQLVAKNIKG
jgi:hypothetical protein